jgi:hypothetical protein
MVIPPAGLPRDPAQWLALGLALAVLAAARPLVREAARPRLFAGLCALSALALSAAYVVVYLRGGPRIVDAGSYFLEARAISEGLLSFPLPAPETSILGRFLVRSEHPDGAHAAVIFPPGYPAVLALGFLAGAPLAVGPILAAAIAVATFDLARSVAGGAPGSPSIPQLAALFSVACAALRYHTADTMSHGLAALCVAASLALAFRARDAERERLLRRAAALAAAAGLAAGWLFATRPVSALALAAPLGLALLRGAPTGAIRRLALALAAGAIPGVILFFAHQHAATGAWGASSQRLYYAVSDGPEGCFRYGFGAGVGCLGEHGDFVRAGLPNGYGLVEAAGTTLRRLKMHLVDPGNLEPLALLVPLGAWTARRDPRGRVLGLAVVAQILAYVPFYFDGNFPGGGGRFYADVLPLEHVLAAVAVAGFAARRRAPERWAAGAVALALAGFAIRAGFDHAELRDREGGRPAFEPAELARAGVAGGLVFVDSDHAFDLGFDPGRRTALDVVRYHGDALDRFAWEARGRPPAVLYRFGLAVDGAGVSSIQHVAFPPEDGPLLVEGESLWPPLAQHGGWALPEWAAGTCASGSRWLGLHAADDRAPASVTVGLPARWLAGRAVTVRVAVSAGARGRVVLRAGGVQETRGFAGREGSGLTCADVPAFPVPGGAPAIEITLERDPGSGPGTVALDALAWARREND